MVTVRSYDKTLIHIKGENKFSVKVQNQPQKIKVVQSVSPIPLTVGGNTSIDGGNF